MKKEDKMRRIKKEDWGDLCPCEYIGVEFNGKRNAYGTYEGNVKASVFKINDNAFCYHDPLEVYSLATLISHKITEKSIEDLLNFSAKKGIKVFTFDTPLELNNWLVDQN